jgi:hypothetical protein
MTRPSPTDASRTPWSAEAVVAYSKGKKAADNATDSAASKRSALIISHSRKITFSLSN